MHKDINNILIILNIRNLKPYTVFCKNTHGLSDRRKICDISIFCFEEIITYKDEDYMLKFLEGRTSMFFHSRFFVEH